MEQDIHVFSLPICFYDGITQTRHMTYTPKKLPYYVGMVAQWSAMMILEATYFTLVAVLLSLLVSGGY